LGDINMLNVNDYKDKLNAVCYKFNLKKLDLFGSATTSKFGPTSDIDVLVEFNDDRNINLFDKYFDLKNELHDVFQRSVDIVIEHSVRNPYFKKSMNKTRKPIYDRRNK
jgi:hypothetical protein